MPNLQVLALDSNQISDAGVAALASALRGGALPSCLMILLNDNPGSDASVHGGEGFGVADSKVKEALESPEREAALALRQAE